MSGWIRPSELPDLRRVGMVAIDAETKDEGLRADRGSAWPWKGGYICGISVAWRAEDGIRAIYIPLRHPETENFERENVVRWLKDLIASGVRFVAQNGLYDWGWLWADLGIAMPSSDRIEEIGALATLIDENQFTYGLDPLCEWRGLPGKDTALLEEACLSAGWVSKRKKTINVAEHIWKLPAHLVGFYGEADPIATLALFENLNPILDKEGTRAAYRLECDLLPMVHTMRRRGLRVRQDAAEQARDYCLQQRNRALAQLSEQLGSQVGMDEIASPIWKARTFDAHSITYPRTPKGNPSFKAGKLGWMAVHPHWLPQLIATANKYDAAGAKFLEGHILAHLIGDRVYAEINPHRGENGGTKSFRFSYSNPPLQQMPSRDEELGPMIRRVFRPEEGELWCTVDCSQQEFRFVVHHAFIRNLPGAKEVVERYLADPNTDYHELTSELTSLRRKDAKNVNFAKIYGAGVKKFAEMIRKPLSEAQVIYQRYDQRLPFVSRLAAVCQQEANRRGYTELYDGARRHWDKWATRNYAKGAGPCPHEEAKQRIRDPGHPWFEGWLQRAGIHTALNAQIQGDAARHTKLWMRACWREGIVPLLQMHDGLELSVATREQGELVARLACEAVKLAVPMRANVKYGCSWGDAIHSWEERHGIAAPTDSTKTMPTQPRSGLLGVTEVAPTSDFRTSELPRASEEDHNPVSDEPPHICQHCHLNGPEPAIAQGGEWLHPGCVDLYLRARMREEGVPWDDPGLSASAPPPPPWPPSRGNRPGKDNGQASGLNGGSKTGAAQDTYAEEHAGEPFDDSFLYRQGYQLAQVFDYPLADGTLLYQQNRYELRAGIAPIKKRPRKRFLPHRKVNGQDLLGAGDRRVTYNWPAIMRAGPGSNVYVCEGESNAQALIDARLLATTVLSHKWTPECIAALTGHHLFILADHDKGGEKLAGDAQKKLAGVAASTRIVPAPHLWKHLPPGAREIRPGDDVKDWIGLGGDPKRLLGICHEIPADDATLESVCAADEDIKALDWIWPGRFALGKIGLLVGLPDEGKGLVLSDIMARITCSLAWPCGEGQAPLGNVILLTAEDDINDTVNPRLLAAGADLSRVTIVKLIHEAGQGPRMFSLITDLDRLRRKALEIGNVKMIIIDPITAYLGISKMDSFRATDVRAVLGPIMEFAAELQLAILAVMHFNKKVDITNVLLRISDSLAYGAAARHVYGVIDDHDNHRKLFVKGKNNLAPRDQPTLAFEFADREVGADKRSGTTIRAPYIMWQPEPVDITATEAMQAAAESKSPGARDNAKQFLEALLGGGPVGSKDVHEAAKENGIARNTLRRAKDELGLEIKKDGPVVDGQRTWQWHLPTKKEHT